MSRSVLRSARAELPLRRAQNIYNFAFGAPVWDWYYNFDAPTDYAAWAMSEMTCQSPMLSDVKPEPGYPNYAGFDESRGAMRRHGARPVADIALFFSSHTRDLNIDIPWQKSLFGIAWHFCRSAWRSMSAGDRQQSPVRLHTSRMSVCGGAHQGTGSPWLPRRRPSRSMVS